MTHVLAEIPNLFGPGFTAQMNSYKTVVGARVFGGSISSGSTCPKR